jgi:uncharacterized protein YyaL (SSP411 family)
VEETSIASITDLNSILKKWEPRIDFDKGGGHSAPKSRCRPTGNTLQYHHLTDPKALKAVTATLDNMALADL